VHLADRDEFDPLMEKLCAGFNVPCTEFRKDAFFAGMRKMTLPQFSRCVDAALEEGLERFTPQSVWALYHKVGTATPPPEPPKEDPDHLEYYANRLLFMHLTHRGGLGSTGRFKMAHGMVECKGSEELQRCLKFERELVEEFCGYIREGDDLATPAAFVRMWVAGLKKVSDVLPRTVKALEQLILAPSSQIPFPAFMARPLTTQRSFA
jgi:hypothetical protein